MPSSQLTALAVTPQSETPMSEAVSRPIAELKKIHSKDEFELCYLRHQYVRRTTHNPSPAEMEPYYHITTNLSRNTFFTYKNLFNLVGLDLEDIISISRVHLVSYLGLFEITKDPVKYEKFLAAFLKKNSRDPEPKDILQKNRANLTLFLKQRMQDIVRVCQQKARNVKGLQTDEYLAYSGVKRIPPWVLPLLPINNEKYGYKKIDVATFKTATKKAKKLAKGGMLRNERFFQLADKWFIRVEIDHRALELEDFAGADMDPREAQHNKNPEQVLSETEQAAQFEKRKADFQNMRSDEKRVVFEAFIRENKKNKNLAQEVNTAEKLLAQMGN